MASLTRDDSVDETWAGVIMAYIIMADVRMGAILEEAAVHLREAGHEVDVLMHYQDILQRVEVRQPDVLVIASSLRGGDGFSLNDELHRRYPTLKTKLIWIATVRNVGGSPAISWDFTDISTFLAFPPSAWQIVLSVEQLLYRIVECPPQQS